MSDRDGQRNTVSRDGVNTTPSIFIIALAVGGIFNKNYNEDYSGDDVVIVIVIIVTKNQITRNQRSAFSTAPPPRIGSEGFPRFVLLSPMYATAHGVNVLCPPSPPLNFAHHSDG